MYKVHFENRFIMISPEPDRIQKYGLFHKFHDTKELYKLIADFQSDKSIHCNKYIWNRYKTYMEDIQDLFY